MSSFTIPTCPLTLQEIVDPVMDPEGNTYERSAITKWVTENGNSPLTRARLTLAQVVPNRILTDMIAQARGPTVLSAPPAADVSIDPNAPPAYAAEPQANIGVSLTKASEGEMVAWVTVDDTTPAPLLHRRHIVVVLDVSGSMGSLATAKAADGSALEDGFTLLNLVQHATKTICHALAPHDRLSIVAFDCNAVLELPPTYMDAAGKANADRVIASLHPKGSTNLWAGIAMGIDTVAAEVDAFTSILVLTDGVPSNRNIDFTGALRRKLAKSAVNGPISFFGFGYSLDSKLLKDLAMVGGGSFGFIPDAGFVGTIFINAVANLSTLVAVNVCIEFHASDVEAIGPLDSDSASTSSSSGMLSRVFSQPITRIHLGVLRYGQPVAFLFKRRGKASKWADLPGATLVCTTIGGKVQRIDVTRGNDLRSGDSVRFEQLRTRSCAAMLAAADKRDFDSVDRSSLVVPADMATSGEVKIDALAADMSGQVQEAVSRKDYYTKWGVHYLYSLGMAHLFCERNNFKDAGVQVYGGALFSHLQDELNDIFMNVDPPKPSGNMSYGRGYGGGGGGTGAPRGPVNMSSYNSSSNVCFAGETVVTLDNGLIKPMAELVRGDVIISDSIGSTGVVDVVVVSECESPTTRLVRLGETLTTTEYHPVRASTSKPWAFPVTIGKTELREIDNVYNVMLTADSRVPSVYIDGYECATLGHGLTDDEVISHDYFGSDLVRRDLMSHDSYANCEDGRIFVGAADVVRNPSTMRIVSIIGDRSSAPELD